MRSPTTVPFLLRGAAAALVVIMAIFATLASAGGSSRTSGPAETYIPAPTPTHAEPVGVEAPLGRYEEPPSLPPFPPAAPAAPALTSSASAPSTTTGFDGIGMEPDSNSFIHAPPDAHAAVGPDSIVEVTNGHVAIFSKTGSIIAGGDTGAGAVDLDSFCGNDCFDPKVIYDQGSARFVAVALEGRTAAASFLHVMVSTTSTPGNLTTDWDKFRHGASATFASTDGSFDYPGLGVSPDAVVVTGNIFSDAGVFIGTKIRVFDKVALYDGDATATFVDIDSDFMGGAPSGSGGTIRPAQHFGAPPPGTFYLFQRWNPTSLRVVALTGVPGSPSVSRIFLSTADQGPCLENAPQQGTSKLLDTLCPRMMNAVWRDGSVWGTVTGSDSTDSRTVVQWFEVETNGFPFSTPTLRQHGTIDGGAGEFTFMPSISVDACENAALTYTQSSSSRFPEMRYTGRLAGDTLNTMQTPVVAKASAFFYDDFTGLPTRGPDERWGDYSATVIDPLDQSFWVAHEYAKVAASGGGNNGRWGTWIANFTFKCGGATPTPTATATSTPTPTQPTPTQTATPTETPDCADNDGDTLCDDVDPDDDNDGCTDVAELQTEAGSLTSGGLRDPKNFWDFYDVYTGNPRARDGAIIAADIAALVLRFGTVGDPGGDPLLVPPDIFSYHTAFDRGGTIPGQNVWNLEPADGAVIAADIASLVVQFGHVCV